MLLQKIKTAATKEPVSLALVKDHVVSLNDELDSLLSHYLKAATEKFENYTDRKLMQQTWYGYLRDWPSEDYIVLKSFTPLESITSIKYKDTSGNESTFSTDDYIVDIVSEPPRVYLGYNSSWPSSLLYPSNPITIELITGYGETAASIPSAIQNILLKIIAFWFENRGEQEMQASVSTLDLPRNIIDEMDYHRTIIFD